MPESKPESTDDELSPHKAKQEFIKSIRNELFTLNFYRAHMLYFIVVIAISSVIVYGEGIKNGPKDGYYDSHVSYMNALFLTCSAMTTTGMSNPQPSQWLNSVNLGDLSGFQQAVLCVLLMVGNIPFVSMVVVLIRQSMFRKRMSEVVKHSRAMQRLVQDIETSHENGQNNGSGDIGLRQRTHAERGRGRDDEGREAEPKKRKIQPLNKRRTFHHQTGFGFVPTPWETKLAKNLFARIFDNITSELRPEQHDYVSFKPHLDSRGRFLELSEHDRLELGGVEYRALQALLFILIGYQLFWYVFGIVFLMPYAYRSETRDILREAQPGGLNPGWWAFFSTVTEFANGGLNVLNANFVPFSGMPYILIIAGALALIGQTQFPIFLRLTIWIMQKMFLLQHPRRCFIYLFPSRQTWYLLAIQITIDITAWLCFEILNIGMPDVEALTTGTRILDGLFQATGLRTSGAYIITFSSLAPACLVAYLVIMYISSYPLVMTLRKTNTYEERSIGLQEGDDSAAAYDIWFQFLAFFLVCIIERAHLRAADPGFDMFSLLFEVTSAYGTDISLSGRFAGLSKVVMLFVMVRGRHRGLPLAIDRSILLPGEELMKRLDLEYGGGADASVNDKNELVRDFEEGTTQAGGSKPIQSAERENVGESATPSQ
ncbi:TrkH-domain-containing protein [Paraphaeosphaeria sporulosa]|uniref:TrkH-domain-containing protein n=1 Tax=Paraphaeosphaeria sporulosa TaxID=1460663 RepID=A0A177C0G7_9PLEO|nr:TrkH-domain-containing protein [Paraphaeosphaeria sporulosa]OAG00389.1 TrkH-domain-containing protein [Paraphaeosphaeria sporulosa]